MSDIPQAREVLADLEVRLQAIGHEPEAVRVRAALALMIRRSPARRRAPVQSARVDAATAAAMRAMARQHPTKSVQEIAEHFGTNHGRVSEALLGER